MPRKVLNCERNHREQYYQKIADSRFFKGEKDLTHGLNFAIAVAFGYRLDKFRPLVHGTWITRVEYIEADTKVKAFFQSIAVAKEKSLKVLLDDDEVYKIAEGYANGGIIHLYNLFTGEDGGGDFDKEIESQINEVMKKSPRVN